MAAEISPVNAPLCSQYIFCAPTLIFCALTSDSTTLAIAVKGGTITTSTADMSPISSNKSLTNSAASACSMFIFQLAATIFFLIKNTGHPERSRGIQLRKLQDNFLGIPQLSLGMTRLIFVRQRRHPRQFPGLQ